jgi:hypothetical protein
MTCTWSSIPYNSQKSIQTSESQTESLKTEVRNLKIQIDRDADTISRLGQESNYFVLNVLV